MDEVKAILFDLDDTLLVEKNSTRDSFIATISSMEPEIDNDEFVKVIREEARKLWYELPTITYCLKVGISSWEALWADFSGADNNLMLLADLAGEYRINSWANALFHFGIRDAGIAEELSDSFKRIRDTKHAVYHDTIECLEQVKPQFKLGLITNGAPDLQWKKIHGSKLQPYFQTLVISGEYGFAKPDKRLFIEALNLMACSAANTLMVGDTLKTDIQGAKEIGIRTIWINRDNKQCDNPDLKPDYEIDSLLQLEEVIRHADGDIQES